VTLGFPEKIIPLYIAGKVTRASTNPLEAWEVRGDVIVLNQAFRGVARFVDHSYASAAVSLDSSLIAKLLCLGGASGAISVEYDVADRTLRLRGDVTASPSSVATCLAERYLGDAGKLLGYVWTSEPTRVWTHVVIGFGADAGVHCLDLALHGSGTMTHFAKWAPDAGWEFMQQEPDDLERCWKADVGAHVPFVTPYQPPPPAPDTNVVDE
jgi:hypothetical protein